MRKQPLLLLLMVVSLAVRLYYLSLTHDQPLWWDEAENALKAKSIATGTPETGWWEGRQVLFPLLLSAFYALGFGETAIRLFLVLISVATVALVYAVGAKMFGDKIGLIAALLFSLEPTGLFSSMRIMADSLHLAIGLLAVLLFLDGRPWSVRALLPILALGTLFQLTTSLFVLVLLVYLALVEGKTFLKRRDYQLSAGLALMVMLPFAPWSRAGFGDLLQALRAGSGHVTTGASVASGPGVMLAYLDGHLGFVLLALLAIEAVFLYDVLFGFDHIVEGRDRQAGHRFLLMIWIAVAWAFYSLVASQWENRFVLTALPPIVLLVALGAERVQGFVAQGQQYQRRLPAVFLTAVLAIGAFRLGVVADAGIRSKRLIFEPVMKAGTWIRENSSAQDKVITMSVPQIAYYSERESHPVPESEEAFASTLASLDPRYVVMSVFEPHPKWIYDVDPDKYGMRPARKFPDDESLLVVYERDR